MVVLEEDTTVGLLYTMLALPEPTQAAAAAAAAAGWSSGFAHKFNASLDAALKHKDVQVRGGVC